MKPPVFRVPQTGGHGNSLRHSGVIILGIPLQEEYDGNKTGFAMTRRLKWTDSLSLGVRQIDDQHRELIRIANGLLNAVELGRPTRVLENVLSRLREYTVFHFHSEETFMEDIRYPERGEHAREHFALKQRVKAFRRRLYRDEPLEVGEVLAFLQGWLLDHILVSDMDIARFLRETGRKRKPGSPGGSRK